MEYARNFDEQKYDESIVDYMYIKETFRERKFSMENFDKSPIIRNHSSNLSDFSIIKYLH